MRSVAIFLAVASIGLGTAAQADVLYSNGAPQQANGTLISGSTRAVADQFTLSTQANILTFEYSNWIVDTNGDSASYIPGTIDWAITSTGLGGTPLASGSSATLTVVSGSTITFSGGGSTTITQRLTSFSAGNVWLPAGSYWLELSGETVSGAPGTISERWGGATPSTNTSEIFNGSALIPSQPSHFLDVIGVPEPITWALFASGLVGIAMVRRRSA